jgi:hypothetical protein
MPDIEKPTAAAEPRRGVDRAMSRNQIRIAQLRKVFSADRSRQLNAKLARLCVLYEDLRVEMCGIAARSIPALDILDSEKDNRCTPERIGTYRRYYFVRRSIGTIREFAEALRLINSDSDLQLNITPVDEDAKATLGSAITFFKANENRLKEIRNDIGGHFGQEAALNALDRLSPDAYSAIELVDGKDLRLRFAGEIAASALLRHLQNDDIQEYKRLLRDCIKPAYKHATRCVQILVLKYLWERFGK